MNKIDLNLSVNDYSRWDALGRVVWWLVWCVLIRWLPDRGCKPFRKWHEFWLRMFGAKIGKRCFILPSVRVRTPWKLRMGDFVAFSENVYVYNADEFVFGSHVVVSRDVFLCGISHDVTSRTMCITHAAIEVASEVWIAARATVLPGVHICEGAVVGACSVVTKDVSAYEIVAGNPARKIKMRAID